MKSKILILVLFLLFNNITQSQLLGGQLKSKAVSIIPSSITLAQNRFNMFVSVYDQDYLPYTVPTVAATTTALAAGGGNEATTINYQGTITTSGIVIKIPATATASGTLPAYSATITIPASLTQDGISRDVTFSWTAQAYTTATTSISVTIATLGGTLNLKKLDINSGLGNDYLGVLIGAFVYPYNAAGNTSTYKLRVVPGIPDKMFGKADNGGSTTTHLMLYAPVMAEDGNIWLSNNLGAHYANINHANFNFLQQATSISDHLAYGSLFQWGRKPDGHELINWTSSSAGTSVYGSTNGPLSEPLSTSSFIKVNDATWPPLNWRTPTDLLLWSLESSTNNPCPIGYRVPNDLELFGLNLNTSNLKFTKIGYRYFGDSNIYGRTSDGAYYFSSIAASNYDAKGVFFNIDGSYGQASAPFAYGLGLRCIKD